MPNPKDNIEVEKASRPSFYRRLISLFFYTPLRFLFGRDVFISYSRADATRYAERIRKDVEALAQKEKKRKPKFYFDRLNAPSTGTRPDVLPASLVRHLKWSSTLVVICSENSIKETSFVGREIELFPKKNRKVITISVGDTFFRVKHKEPWRQISGASPDIESPAALEMGEPSESIIQHIFDIAQINTQDLRLTIAAWVAFVAVILSVGGLIATYLYTDNLVQKAEAQVVVAEDRVAKETEKANIAISARVQAEEDAKRTVEDANKKVREANSDVELAEGKEREANKKAGAATKLAREKTEFAGQQQQIAADSIKKAEKQRKITDRLSYAADMKTAHDLYKRYDIERFTETLINADRRFRGPEWSYLNQLTKGVVKFRNLPDEIVSEIEFSPDERHLLVKLLDSNRLLKFDRLTGIGRPLGTHKQDDKVRDFVFSAKEKRLAYLDYSAETLIVWNISTPEWERQAVPLDPADKFKYVSFTPDGKEIITINQPQENSIGLTRWDTQTLAKLGVSNTPPLSEVVEIIKTSSTGQMLVRHGDKDLDVSEVIFQEDQISLLDSSLKETKLYKEIKKYLYEKIVSAHFFANGEKVLIRTPSGAKKPVRIFSANDPLNPEDISHYLKDRGNLRMLSEETAPISDTGNTVVLTFNNGVRIVDLDSKRIVRDIPLNRALGDVAAVSPSGKYVSVNVDMRENPLIGAVQVTRLGVWEVNTREDVFDYGNGKPVLNCENCANHYITEDNSRLVTLTESNVLTLWDTFKVTELAKEVLPPAASGETRWAQFSPGEKLLYSYVTSKAPINGGNLLRLWNADNGAEINLKPVPGCVFASAPVFTAAEKQVAVYCKGGRIGLWDTQTGDNLRNIDTGIDALFAVLALENEDSIVTIHYPESEQTSVDFKTGAVVPAPLYSPYDPNQVRQYNLKSPDNKWTIFGDRTRGYFLRNEETIKPILLAPPGIDFEPAFSKDGKFLMVHTDTDFQQRVIPKVFVKNLETMSHVVLKELESDTTSFELSPLGNWIWRIKGDSKIYYWNTGDGKKYILESCTQNPIFTSDKYENRLITNCADGTIKFWYLSAGQEVLSIRNDQPDIRTQSFSPAEDRLLTVSDTAVKLWRIKF